MEEMQVPISDVLTVAEHEFGAEFARVKMEAITRAVLIQQLREEVASLRDLVSTLQEKLEVRNEAGPVGD